MRSMELSSLLLEALCLILLLLWCNRFSYISLIFFSLLISASFLCILSFNSELLCFKDMFSAFSLAMVSSISSIFLLSLS